MVNADENMDTVERSQTVTVPEDTSIMEENGQTAIAKECKVLDSNSSRVEAENGVEEDDSGDEDDSGSTSSRANSESWTSMNVNQFHQANAMFENGSTPAQVLKHMFPHFEMDVSRFDDRTIVEILSDLLDRPTPRVKLAQYNTLNDAIELFKTKKKILVLTGAGVSVSCGIPDFRSEDGIYARLHKDFPDLPDPTAMFDIRYFRNNPAPFYDFAKELFPGQFTPSVSHRFIKLLEDNDQLLRNYTQNIDTLEVQTGITRVVECHGSFSKATCLQCGEKFEGDIIKDDVMNKRVAICKVCNVGVIKPDIVFFGENLGEHFHRQMTIDKKDVDLVVVIGSSLKVRPVSLIPHSVSDDVPQILINRESLRGYRADIELLGNCDDIIRDICFTLGGKYTEMIEDYDREVKKSIQQATKKRRFIEMNEFHEIMCNEEDKHALAKRPRIEDDSLGPSVSSLVARFVPVQAKLPDLTCAQVSSNQTVFPGAELTYDLNTKTVCRGKVSDAGASASTDDDGESSSSSDGTKLERTTSVDQLDLDEKSTGLSNGMGDVEISDSCPPFLEYEESNKIGPTDFRQACQDLKEIQKE